MLQEIQGDIVTVYLSVSAWGDSTVKGVVVEITESWLKLKGKKDFEFVNLNTIKRITLHAK